jgi:hypothetical protein
VSARRFRSARINRATGGASEGSRVPFAIRSLRPLIVVFVATRALGAFLAGHPDAYTGSLLSIIFDVNAYGSWAHQIVELGSAPYAQVPIEYPPGALPFILIPAIMFAIGGPYLLGFVALMVLVDGLGLLGLVLLARRWSSSLGPWLWVLGLPLLGPLSWVRLDIVPAVATIWAIVAAATSRWAATASLLSFGALTKVYPAFLLPAAWKIAYRRRAFLLGVVGILFLATLPLIRSVDDMLDSVAVYHLQRGIQAESLWANGLFIAHRLGGYPVKVVFEFGSDHVASSISPELQRVSTMLSVLALLPGILFASRRANRGDAKTLAAIMFTTVSLLLIAGRVLSPQYMLWLIALGAATACVPNTPIRGPVLLMLPTAAATQLVFPFLTTPLVSPDMSALVILALVLLTIRNALLLLIAGWSLAVLWKRWGFARDGSGSHVTGSAG